MRRFLMVLLLLRPFTAKLTVVHILAILTFSAIAQPTGQAPEKTNSETPSVPQTNLPSIATNATDAGQLLREGQLLYETGKFSDAELILKAALALRPDSQAAHNYLDLIEKRQHPLKSQDLQYFSTGFDGNQTTFKVSGTDSRHEAISRKLDTFLLDKTPDEWADGISLNEAIRFLTASSKLHDPDKTGVNFLFDPRVKQGDAETNLDADAFTMKMTMINVRLLDVLDAMEYLVTDSQGDRVKYSVEDYGVVFSVKTNRVGLPPLEMRVFRVDPNIIFATVRNITDIKTNDEVKSSDLLKFFSTIGEDLTAPGRAVAFNERLGLLFVKAAPSELDTIERVIQVLNETAPQIHIKARFIEVPMPKAGDFISQLFSNTVAGQMTGILTDSKFRMLLHAYGQRNGFESLAEPECVATSGRQTRMCATIIGNILTNFDFQEISSNLSFGGAWVGNGQPMDVFPSVLADGYTVKLIVTTSVVTYLGSNEPPKIPGIDGVVQLKGPLPTIQVQFTNTTVNLRDGQTLVFGNMRPDFARGFFVGAHFQNPNEPNPFQDEQTRKRTTDKELLVFITATIVDSTGKPVHSDDDLPFNSKTIPPQPR